jgi:hypothetical protein
MPMWCGLATSARATNLVDNVSITQLASARTVGGLGYFDGRLRHHAHR